MNNLMDGLGQTVPGRHSGNALQQDQCRDSITVRPSSRRPRPIQFVERLLDNLNDPTRCEWTAALLLVGYAGVWTLYGVIAKGSQDIHIDMSEQFVLGRELALGYDKHPPLTMLIVRLSRCGSSGGLASVFWRATSASWGLLSSRSCRSSISTP
jgi:hypothetical protein